MGWDAYSSAEKNGYPYEILDPVIKKDFELAYQICKEKTSQADGYLDVGGLDCSLCAKMLQKATGESCWNLEGWTAKIVRQLNESANWKFRFNKDEAWAYWSAKLFLETCAKHNLSIYFSF